MTRQSRFAEFKQVSEEIAEWNRRHGRTEDDVLRELHQVRDKIRRENRVRHIPAGDKKS